ncbi:MAG: hypothetical protein IJW63_05440 [Lachnospiraceae bacterium]|nr:hypothetical protein [Lachnospiraceae bacterium]
MKIKYKIGKKTYEEDYFPKEKIEYLMRGEEYLFDAALQLEISKLQSIHEDWFVEREKEGEKGIREHQLLFPDETRDENEVYSPHIRYRVENLIRSYAIASECISELKDLVEQLYESQKEALLGYGELEGNAKIEFDEFQEYLLDFLNRVEVLLSAKNSLAHPLADWDAQMPIFQTIPCVSIEKFEGIIGNVQKMIRGEYDNLEKYKGKINNNLRKQYIRNQLNLLPSIFTEKIVVEPDLLRSAKTAVWGRSISQIDNIKMMVNPSGFEQRSGTLEEAFVDLINESAECPYSYEEITNDDVYVSLIGKLEDNIDQLIKLNRNKKKNYFENRKCCVAVFDLNATTRLFSLSGPKDYDGTYDNNHVNWPPADKVYSVLSEDSLHRYVWCKLTPAVKRYRHKAPDKSIWPLSEGVAFETLGSLTSEPEVPKELGGDFSCCERKIFAYFENDLTQCDSFTKMTTRWPPCELCKPAINDLYNSGKIYIDCYYIWESQDKYVEYLNKYLEERRSRERREV